MVWVWVVLCALVGAPFTHADNGFLGGLAELLQLGSGAGAASCPNDCSGRGTCANGVCRCDVGWTSRDCSVMVTCPNDCSAHGICAEGVCECDSGFAGEDCAQVSTQCPNDCMSRGTCVEGKCHCDRGYTGPDCSKTVVCKELDRKALTVCSSLGFDPREVYYVQRSLDLAAAEQQVQQLMEDVNKTCIGKAVSKLKVQAVLCGKLIPFCNPGTQEPVKVCRSECALASQACQFDENKFCAAGYVDDREEDVPPYMFHHEPAKWKPKCREVIMPGEMECPNGCSGHGRCDTQDGVCLCDHKWGGLDCSVPQCPNNCSLHGECLGDPTPGVCKCDAGWSSADCSFKLCPNDCTSASNGKCDNGTCICYNPWGAADCSIPICPNNCSLHGECLKFPAGVCRCDVGYAGKDCSEKLCPKDCSGHGKCDKKTGICECDDPWTLEDCSKAVCPKDCSDHGTCLQRPHKGKVAGDCLCDSPYFGEDCASKYCPNNCSDHGSCDFTNGTCTCDAMYYTEDCSKSHCPNDCHVTHGKCIDTGVCECFSPWKGMDCGVAECPNDCNAHGDCLQTTEDAGKCRCYPPWAKDDCSLALCPKNCSGHGDCLQKDPDAGKCACFDPWFGSDCSGSLCPNGCSNHGSCVDGKCICTVPWVGDDCARAECPKNCTDLDHGTCDETTGVCKCKDPYTGVDCATALCPNDCSHNGYCNRDTGKCTCDSPYFGEDCSRQPCPDDCSGHGTCNTANGQCDCDEGWYGNNCAETTPSTSPTPSSSSSVSPSSGASASPSTTTSASPSMVVPSPSATVSPSASPSTDLECPRWCSGHGQCNTGTGKCTCDKGWSGDDCAEPVCDCNGRGRCVSPGLCVCDDGFTGDDCSGKLCNNGCSGHGQCNTETGTCLCDDLWSGDDCSVKLCKDCKNGVCLDGVCKCHEGFTGDTCSELLCPTPCLNGGKCVNGKCECPAPYSGDDCSEMTLDKSAVPPPPQCPDCKNGKCVGGKCVCDEGFEGVDCNLRKCSVDCGNGTCNPLTGKCDCPFPFYGEDCRGHPCPGDPVCSNHGDCAYEGQCVCQPDYFGEDCSEFSCPNNCSAHGVCARPQVCECMEGWQGKDCSEPICPKMCSNHGICEVPNRCRCDVGWTGDACDEPVPCPNQCSGRGDCINGTCMCPPDFLGADCSVEVTQSCQAEGCNSRGACACSGVCECTPGFVGRLCQRPARCLDGCSGKGQCIGDGVCKCYDGFSGATCNIDANTNAQVSVPCVKGCSGQGFCNPTDSTCTCFIGFGGADCSEEQAVECPKACSEHGLCEVSVDTGVAECNCRLGFAGVDCSEPASVCPNACSCQGDCVDNRCVCHEGFIGPDCSERACPNDCSGHGICTDGTCTCNEPWYEADCSVAMCPYNCTKHGVCDQTTGKCTCNPGWKSDDCSQHICPGTPECSSHGACNYTIGECNCDNGYVGEACECQTCPKNCSAHGTCSCDGTCECSEPYYGDACEFLPCPNECSHHGQCNKNTGKCQCDQGWKEADCSRPMCPGEADGEVCANHGVCDQEHGICDCDPGWAGTRCTEIARTKCPKDCSGPSHGTCVNSVCECAVGWVGPSCSIPDEKCPEKNGQPCSNHGTCLKGKCYCTHGWIGEACETPLILECPRNCSDHGVCINGQCKCEWDYVGSACQKFRCPNGCSKHGYCDKNSTCQCDPGFETLSPEDCAEGPYFSCNPECQHGKCNTTSGKCACDAGFEGPTCNIVVCPNRCYNVGDCVEGVCDCHPGYTGIDCGLLDLGDHFCSGKGVYSRASGLCECIEGFSGTDCSITTVEGAFSFLCMTNCTGRGICDEKQHKCNCAEGWEGLDCSERVEKCFNLCRGYGTCDGTPGLCNCQPMFRDDSCGAYLGGFEENDVHVIGPSKSCPNACNEHGLCNPLGECQCFGNVTSLQAYWSGPDCADGHCPGDCSGHGSCDEVHLGCNCTEFWSGVACDVAPPPCSGCSGRGKCNCAERVIFQEKEQCACDCDPGFRGIDCEDVIPCPAPDGVVCSGRGKCIFGVCECNHGFEGESCATTNISNPILCPVSKESVCSGHGSCLINGQCDCWPGFEGPDCGDKVTDCPRSCNGNGICNDDLGLCTCFEGYKGVDCSEFVKLPVATRGCYQNCTGHGRCCNGRCKCADGWRGATCNIPAPACPNRCSGNGYCTDANICHCQDGYFGVDCSEGPEKTLRCPRDCMGNGVCDGNTGHCTCLYEYEGADCSISAPRCPNNCSGNGDCISVGQGVSGGSASVCDCLDGYGGEDCSVMLQDGLDSTVCPSNCSGHGVCLDYQCYCSTDYKGKACNILDRRCPHDCSGFGLCEDGCCNCIEGYDGIACGIAPEGPLPEEPTCRNNCTAHGICTPYNRRCICRDPWTYDDCSVLQEDCPGTPPCSNHGECLLARCSCDPDWSGPACDISVTQEKAVSDLEGYLRGLRHNFYNLTAECKLGCSAHGTCDGATGICHCWDGWSGEFCELGEPNRFLCPMNCSGHGECVDGQCSCDIGYYGVACEKMNMPCPYHCSGKGICTDGVCNCIANFTGDACENFVEPPFCAVNCTGNGICMDGDCHCPTGFRGIDCSITIGRCPNSCSGNGLCNPDHTCTCVDGYSGPDCSLATTPQVSPFPPCPANCSGKGVCELGACVCDSDQGWDDCAVTVFVCPSGCSGNGRCVGGGCQCNDGYTGERCEVGIHLGDSMCPQNCSGRGRCVSGACDCYRPWGGIACDHISACPNDCSNHGVCETVCGQCTCYSGWGGVDCAERGGCPNGCSKNGQCQHGVCYCEDLFEGEDCARGKDLVALCQALHTEQPGFLDAECDVMHQEEILTAVAEKWDTEPTTERAARIFRAMREDHCSDMLWRVENRIILIARKIHNQLPGTLSKYDEIKANAYDICYVHSLFEPRMKLYEVRDKETTPPIVSLDIELLIQECNLFHSLVFNFTNKDILRSLRSQVKTFAVQVTDLDPSILNFESFMVDDLLNTMADPGQGGLLMRRAISSVVDVADVASRLVLTSGRSNAMLDMATDELSDAINRIYDLGLFTKYFDEVMSIIKEGQRFGLSSNGTVVPNLLPHNLDLSSVLIAMVEDNTGEKARDLVFGQAPTSPERVAVNKLLGALNVITARGYIELPTLAALYDLKTKIKLLAQNLYKLDPAAIDNPSPLTPDEITTILLNPESKAKLRELQKQPELYKTATLLLHDVNAYQSYIHFLVVEARRLAFALRIFDETLAPDLGVMSQDQVLIVAGQLAPTQDPRMDKVISLAKASEYIKSLQSYLDGDDLELSAQLVNDVRQFYDVMRALSGALPFSAASFVDVSGQREIVIDMTDYAVHHCGLPEFSFGMDTATTTRVVESLKEPAMLKKLNTIAENVPDPETVSAQEYAQAVECSNMAKQLLIAIEALSQALDDAQSLLFVLGESLHRLSAAAGNSTKHFVFPDPSGEDTLTYCSKIYDYPVWTNVRVADMIFRAKESNATSVEEDQVELADIVSKAGVSGDMMNWGTQIHALVDAIIGLLGFGDAEMMIREAMIKIQQSTSILRTLDEAAPQLIDAFNGVTSVPSLNGYYQGNKSVVQDPTGKPPQLPIVIMDIVVEGLPEVFVEACGSLCVPYNEETASIFLPEASSTPAGAATSCAHYSLAGNPELFLMSYPLRLSADTNLHSVRCCTDSGDHMVQMTTYGCHTMKTYKDAKRICEDNQYRLCTKEEIFDCKTCGTGCGFDRHRVWTSTPRENQEPSCEDPPSTALVPTPTPSTSPNAVQIEIAELQHIVDRLAELSEKLKQVLVKFAAFVLDNSPQCVPSLVGAKNLDDPNVLIDLLSTEEAVQTLVRCIPAIPHGELRIQVNNVLHIVQIYASSYTSLIDAGPGQPDYDQQDPTQVMPAPCSGNGVVVNNTCVCNEFTTGELCDTVVNWDQAYQDGWRKGFEASLANVTTFSQPQDIVVKAATVFDRAATLLKSTAIAMSKIAPSCEAKVPTSYLSALEVLRTIEDPLWLEAFRSCQSSSFVNVIPKLLKEAALLRRELDDLATMVKHLAIKAATLDCKAMQMLAVDPVTGVVPACGQVAQILTVMDKAVILEKCLTDPVVFELQTLLRMEQTAPMKHTVDDMLELINAALRHSACDGQCSKRGTCVLRMCECFEGWTGVACTHEVALPPGVCPRNCTNHGQCIDGKCKCDVGWKAYDCSFSTACPNNCNGHGDCIDGTCHCFRRWRGSDCSLPREICPDDFKCFHGVCQDSYCICEKGWTGDDCTIGDFFAKMDEDGFFGDVADTAVFLQQRYQQRQQQQSRAAKVDIVDLMPPQWP